MWGEVRCVIPERMRHCLLADDRNLGDGTGSGVKRLKGSL